MKRTTVLYGLSLAVALSLLTVTPVLGVQDEPAAVDQQQMAEPESEEGEPVATTPSSAAPTGVVGAVKSAARETAVAVEGGGAELAQQGKAVWSEVLVPMWQRVAAAVPGVVKALALLLAFWLIAVVMSGLVRRLLKLTKADDRAAADWGLGGMLRTKDGKTRSIENLAGQAVKWLILLFGFVAFFQALDLSMVAAPLERVIARIVGVIPNLLQATVILAVYWILASLLRAGTGRGLSALGFDKRVSRYIPEREVNGEILKPSGLVARLVFYVILILGVAPFLDALGQRSLVAPLSQMVEKTLGFLPNLAAAALIFFLGHLIGTVVKEVVSNLLAATGADAGARKLGLATEDGALKLSGIAGSVAYFFIIVPVVGAAVDALGILAISEPISRTLTTLLAAIPLIFVAVVVGGLGYFLAKIVRGIVQAFLHGVGFDALPEKLGLQVLKRDDSRLAPSAVVGTAVMITIILLTVEQAFATLQLDELSASMGRLIGFVPEILIALALVLVAWVVASQIASLVESAVSGTGPARVLPAVARYSILGFGIALALAELGVGGSLISVIVAAVLGGAALALGLAFGLGGKERARQLIEGGE